MRLFNSCPVKDGIDESQDLASGEQIRIFLTNKPNQQSVYITDKARGISKQPNQLKQADTSADPINGAAVWDAFTEDVRIMFEGLKEYDIKGKEDYQRLLLHGLATILLRKLLGTEQQAQLEESINHISGGGDLFNILKRAVLDRVLAVRNMVYLDFWRYKATFQYYSLVRELDLNIYTSSVQRIADYQSDAARMQAAVSSFGVTVRIQSKTFSFKVPLEAEQKSSLSSKGGLKYQPSLTSLEVEG
ncbi:hypothetical protein H2198_002743 [Neophaeococcomyces mojaviensis]|uniref:Uncharacterized protein n=1 Tax=Neophaeococcomyces mojaviensis TaxID=3383035 RepID=A0ACC3AE02_9EURO|nr:hypothetical protein H2198_002743 [Knufia sp. JES_112]